VIDQRTQDVQAGNVHFLHARCGGMIDIDMHTDCRIEMQRTAILACQGDDGHMLAPRLLHGLQDIGGAAAGGNGQQYVTGLPQRFIFPVKGFNIPLPNFRIVDFPEPLAPRRPMNSPALIENVIPLINDFPLS